MMKNATMVGAIQAGDPIRATLRPPIFCSGVKAFLLRRLDSGTGSPFNYLQALFGLVNHSLPYFSPWARRESS